MLEKKIDPEIPRISVSHWKQFELEAYRIENHLAAEKNYAEARLRAIEASRTWRLTAPIRKAIDVLIRPLARSRHGLRLLRWLSSKI